MRRSNMGCGNMWCRNVWRRMRSAASRMTATVIGNCGRRERSQHYSHRAWCDCGFPHGLAPVDYSAPARRLM